VPRVAKSGLSKILENSKRSNKLKNAIEVGIKIFKLCRKNRMIKGF
jgi:hypothetical protein